MSDDLEARLRRVEDLLEITQLFHVYGQLLDAGDVDSYVELFADDGELRLGPVGKAVGRDEIRSMMTAALAPVLGRTYHIISSPVIELDGDTATSEVMWTVVTRGDDGDPIVTMLGRHRDRLVRERGRWRFAQRRGFIDIPKAFRPN